ncbi:hypothetical protein [Pseudoalteromonas marina]|uniref:hypothetical protein n=1 Tax=Pseudoalteromonas marina TaxID=267375 RepID=UPI0035C80E30
MALPSLDTQQVRKIEKLIAGWSTKLTWTLLVKRIASDFDITTTRQTLNSYGSIKAQFKQRKQQLRGEPTKDKEFINYLQADVDVYEERKRLKAEIALLEKKTETQLAFIQLIADTARRKNPQLLEVLSQVKRSLRS